MIAIVCGGRDFTDEARIFEALDDLHASSPFTLIKHGAARGADMLAAKWADLHSIAAQPFPAEWDNVGHPEARVKSTRDGRKYDANAGPRRNREMLASGADTVIAFPGGGGTEHMTGIAIEAVRRGDVKRLVVLSP